MPAPTRVIQRTKTPVELPPAVQTYRADRDQLVGPSVREKGELLPEAEFFPLLESLERTGYLRGVVVTGTQYVDAVKKYCPELAEELGSKVGIDPAAFLDEE